MCFFVCGELLSRKRTEFFSAQILNGPEKPKKNDIEALFKSSLAGPSTFDDCVDGTHDSMGCVLVLVEYRNVWVF